METAEWERERERRERENVFRGKTWRNLWLGKKFIVCVCERERTVAECVWPLWDKRFSEWGQGQVAQVFIYETAELRVLVRIFPVCLSILMSSHKASPSHVPLLPFKCWTQHFLLPIIQTHTQRKTTFMPIYRPPFHNPSVIWSETSDYFHTNTLNTHTRVSISQ